MSPLLGSAHIKTLAREESVCGVLVRMVMEQAESADSAEMELLENALQLLLTRFQAIGGDVS
ncbi:MAG: hypothetical protein ACSLFH_03815 [Desulfuromonadales bacterium]